MRTPSWGIVALLAVVAIGCGGKESAPAFPGHWTSRPKEHGESKEAVEFFGEATVRRLHEAGNAVTPPIVLDLGADGRFEAKGRLVPEGVEDARAWGRWKIAGRAVRLDVEGEERAASLPRILVLPAEGISLGWRTTPVLQPTTEDDEESAEDDEVLLFRE